MFNQLKTHITKENLQKIKKKHDRYEDTKWDQYQLKQNNDLIMPQQQMGGHQHSFKIMRNEYHTPQYKNHQVQRQIQILQQKLKLSEESHVKQISYITQKFQREILALNVRLSNKEKQIQKTFKQHKLIQELKKNNKKLIELKEELEKQLQQKSMQCQNVLQKNKQLQIQFQAIQKKIIQIKILENIKKNTEKDQQEKKQIQNIINKNKVLEQKNNNLSRNVFQLKQQIKQLKICYEKQHEQQLLKIREQNTILKERNNTLQNSLISHLMHASTLLKQNSLICIKYHNNQKKNNQNNETINLQSSINNRVTPSLINSCTQCFGAQQKINKFKNVLQKANSKIVQLLKQKCSKS